MKKKKNKYSKYLWAIIPIALIVFFLLRPKENSQDFFEVKFKQMTETVYASGNILPKNEYKVFATADGILTQKLAKEGDEVTERQVLFVIENTQQNIRLGNAKDNYNIARQKYNLNSPTLKELELSIASAKTKMENDKINYERFENLRQSNVGTQADYDQAKLAYETSKNNYKLQKARYESVKQDLLLNMQNAQSQVELNAELNEDFLVRSLINGRVFETYKEQGEVVKRGEAIALVGASEDVYIQLEVDELDINKIKLNQEILIKIDVYKDKIFKAKVKKIYQMLNKRNQSFRVDAEFVDAYPSVYSGLTVEANIIIQQKPKALVIPKSFLVGEDSVWVLKEEKEAKIKIEKGIENFEWVEVRKGIKANTKIIKK